ncbi:MAG: glycosyltransferase family 4 protein [Chloroflexi bacterium]|nr:glycosyltransferase family 4 protein [Chloroflexota bacterium]MCL5076414.1 glycosyltransferase family 4 protein [Chloroflexota bacterium]
MGRTKILYVNATADLYGASRSLLRLLSVLNRQRYEPIVVLPGEGPLRKELESNDIGVVVQPSLSVIRRRLFHSWRVVPFLFSIIISVVQLANLIRQRRIDIVHSNNGVVLSGALAAKLMRRPHVWHLREIYAEYPLLWSFFAPLALWTSQRIICVSKAVRDQFGSKANDDVRLIYNGLDLRTYDNLPQEAVIDFQNRFGLDPEEKLVVAIGRISSWKGHDFFLKACALLKDRIPRAKFMIVGDCFPGNEAYLENLQRLVKELGLEKQVIFTGFIADTRPVLARADVFVLPSILGEPFGGVVLEAMAMRKAIVATNVGGTLEQIEHERSGILVPTDSAEQLARAIERILTDKALQYSLRAGARRRLEEMFTLDKTVSQIEELYASLSEGN